jgi:hypothetical protein
MNPLSRMRDPRESQAWMPTVGGYVGPNDDLLRDTQRFAALLRDINPGYGDGGLRDRIKVLSFSTDDPRVDDDSTRTIYDWGFARPRLWEHYANRHQGVCLCFDRVALSEYIHGHLDADGVVLDQPLTYRNGEIESLFFLAEDLRVDEIYAVDNVYLPALDPLCDSAHAAIFRLSWVNGFPRLAPP